MMGMPGIRKITSNMCSPSGCCESIPDFIQRDALPNLSQGHLESCGTSLPGAQVQSDLGPVSGGFASEGRRRKGRRGSPDSMSVNIPASQWTKGTQKDGCDASAVVIRTAVAFR